MLSVMSLMTVSYTQANEAMKLVAVPDSHLSVSVPSNWSSHKIYSDVDSLAINLPRLKNGGTPMYPQFSFQFFHGAKIETSFKKATSHIRAHIYAERNIKFKESPAKTFTIDSEVIYDFASGGSATGQITEKIIFVGLSKGVLTCSLQGSKKQVLEFSTTLAEYCISALK